MIVSVGIVKSVDLNFVKLCIIFVMNIINSMIVKCLLRVMLVFVIVVVMFK